MTENITTFEYNISTNSRQELNNHTSFLIWFTGLSGSGKSSIANQVEKELFKRGIKTYLLDGDNIRKGINKDLTFAPKDRKENIRRIGEICSLMVDAGLITLATFISPYKLDRENVKCTLTKEKFIEIYVNTSLEECERRDVKGLYKKARAGLIKDMTGIDTPYEIPQNPDIEIQTANTTIEEATLKIIKYIEPKLKL
jgi:adenylylsulfate kinase